jgi:hypothetical protein
MAGESKLEAKMVDRVQRAGGLAVKVGHSGWPDRVVLLPGGQTVWVELKNPNGRGKVSPLQQHRIDTLTRLGHQVRVVDHEEDFPC